MTEAIETTSAPVEGELLDPVRPKHLGNPLAELVSAAAAAFRVAPEEVLSRERHAAIAAARHAVAWRMRTKWGWSFPHIGRALGGMDHTTIMSAVKRIDREIEARSTVGRIVLELFEPSGFALERVPGEGVVLELEEVTAR